MSGAIFVDSVLRRNMTAGQMKLVELEEALKSYDIMTVDVRKMYRVKYSGFTKVNFMNMKIMAAALFYIQMNPETENMETFTRQAFSNPKIGWAILPFVSDTTKQELQNGIFTSTEFVAKKIDLFRYIMAILSYDRDNQIQFEEN